MLLYRYVRTVVSPNRGAYPGCVPLQAGTAAGLRLQSGVPVFGGNPLCFPQGEGLCLQVLLAYCVREKNT